SHCAGNVGLPPLPCMLMRATTTTIAHETSGAARIRHSLRPLIFQRSRELLANLGRNAPRDAKLYARHPEARAQRASKDESATAGPSSFEARKGAHLRMTDRDPETPMIEPIRRGVLDHPLEPVIGLAKGETRWRVMTVLGL